MTGHDKKKWAMEAREELRKLRESTGMNRKEVGGMLWQKIPN
jgi:hypothetical protein